MATLPPQQKIPQRGSAPEREGEAPMWLQRASLAVLVVTCIYLGLLLLVLPWTRIWQENQLLLRLPQRAAAWLQTGSARGLVSGLGLLDIWIGLGEMTRWRRRHGRR